MIADYSTTVAGIPILIAGGCWAQCQLHAGIRYVPVASKLRISLALVEGGYRWYPGGILLEGSFLYNRYRYFNSDCRRLLGLMPASRRYKVHPYAIRTHEVADLSGGSTLVEFYSKADSSTTVRGIPIRIAGGCWA